VKLKILKRRFGIQAPRMSVRPSLPWYVRWFGIVTGFVGVIGLAYAAYHYGEEYAGFKRHEVSDRLKQLATDKSELEKSNAVLKSELAVMERQLQIGRAAQGDLAKQVKELSHENARLREDVALVQTISAPASKVEGVNLSSVRIEPNAVPGEYSYRIVLLQTGTRSKPFRGWYQLVITTTQGGKRTGLTLPASGEPVAAPYRLDFRVHQRVDGTFRVEPGTIVRSVQVRVFEEAQSQPKVMQTVEVS
jgi:hypothetical protein